MRGRQPIIAFMFLIGAFAIGATSSTAPPPCDGDDDENTCDARCTELVEALRVPLPPLPSSTAACIVRGDGSDACGCFVDAVTSESEIDIARGDIVLSPQNCPVSGRLGNCLVPATATVDCTPDTPEACAEVCETIDAARAADRARVIDASVTESRCAFMCDCTITVGGQCTAVSVRNVDDTDVALAGTLTGNTIAESSLGPCNP